MGKKIQFNISNLVWDKLVQKAVEEGFLEESNENTKRTYGMNKYVNYILNLYLTKPDFIKSNPNEDKMIALLTKQQETFSNLNLILHSAAKKEKEEPIESDSFSRVLTLLKEKKKLKMSEICLITGIKMEILLGLLGHLYIENKIAYDNQMRYYLL
jgi:hypothetical protein